MNGPFFPAVGGDGSSVGVFAVADGVDAPGVGVFLGEADEVVADAETRRLMAVRMFMAMCWRMARMSALASSEMMMRFKPQGPCSRCGSRPLRIRDRRRVVLCEMSRVYTPDALSTVVSALGPRLRGAGDESSRLI